LDVLKFQVETFESLKQWTFESSALVLGQEIMVLGFARDHLESRDGRHSVVPRLLRSYVVSAYDDECEIDKPLITTMSGSPVIDVESGHVVGIASANRQYGIEQYQTESIVQEMEGAPIKREVYEYKETSRFGVFIKASEWLTWAQE
jgi:hypothetical protein